LAGGSIALSRQSRLWAVSLAYRKPYLMTIFTFHSVFSKYPPWVKIKSSENDWADILIFAMFEVEGIRYNPLQNSDQ
jgi:hypothetical protein